MSSDTSIDSPPIHICRIKSIEGVKDFATLLSPELAIATGLGARSIVGVMHHPLAEDEEITPEVFAESNVFVEFMHQVIARHGPDQADCIAEARRLGNGWVFIVDQRTKDPGGRIPAEDVIGAFQARDGAIVPGSYSANPRHRVLSDAGFFQLPAGLAEALVRATESQGGAAG